MGRHSDTDLPGATTDGRRQLWRRLDQQRQRPRPEARGQSSRERRQGSQALVHLPGIGGDERQRVSGRPAFDRKDPFDGAGAKRVHREPVQRVGRQRDHAGRLNRARPLVERGLVGPIRIHDHAAHRGYYGRPMVWHYSKILHQTWFGMAVGGDVPWLWPLFETLHFFGMALLIGIAGAIDLRMLGMARGLPLGPMLRLLPWALLGFAITLVTGVGFYAGNPAQYQTWTFLAKMMFVALAGANVIHFYTSGLYRCVVRQGTGQEVPPGAKLAAAASLFLWLGVMFWGRMLPAFRAF